MHPLRPAWITTEIDLEVSCRSMMGTRDGASIPQEQPMTADNVTAILHGLDSVRAWQEDFYRDLHAHPELSHQERRTAANVAARLREHECVVHEQVGGTGVVGVLRNGDGPTVLLRADMDALPVREETGLPYASKETAAEGDAEVPVMHACGHDVHVTCLLGAVALMAQARVHWSGTLVAVFQPAAETADGAKGMLDQGLASIVGQVDVAMAQHVLPMPAGTKSNVIPDHAVLQLNVRT